METEVAKNILESQIVNINKTLDEIERSYLYFTNNDRRTSVVNIALGNDTNLRTISTLQTINLPFEANFLCVGLNNIYALCLAAGKIYQIDINTGKILYTYNVASPTHAYFQDIYLYVSTSTEIAKINVIDNTISYSSIAFVPKALCISGEFIWAIDNASENIYKINKHTLVTDLIIINTGTAPSSICYDGNYIWVTNLNEAIKIDPNTNVIDATITFSLTGVKQVISNGIDVVFLTTQTYLTQYRPDPLQLTVSSGSFFGANSCQQICFDGQYIYGNDKESPTVTKIKKFLVGISAPATSTNGIDYEALNYIVTDGNNMWMARTGFAELLKISLDLL